MSLKSDLKALRRRADLEAAGFEYVYSSLYNNPGESLGRAVLDRSPLAFLSQAEQRELVAVPGNFPGNFRSRQTLAESAMEIASGRAELEYRVRLARFAEWASEWCMDPDAAIEDCYR